MNIPEMLRYKPGFSVDLVGNLAVPLGEYDNSSPINLDRIAGTAVSAHPLYGK